MANVAISALPAALTTTSADLVPIVQSATPVSNQNITTEAPQQGEVVEKKTSYAQRRRRKKATANANPIPEKTSEIK